VQLTDFLNNGGADRLNVIAISWTEGRYGDANEGRLQRFVRNFHPAIRVIRATDSIEKDFSPVQYVPANFVFDKKGKRAYGDGSRHHLGKSEIKKIVDKLS